MKAKPPRRRQDDFESGMAYLCRAFNVLDDPQLGFRLPEDARKAAMRTLWALHQLYDNTASESVGQVAAAEGDGQFQRFLVGVLQGR